MAVRLRAQVQLSAGFQQRLGRSHAIVIRHMTQGLAEGSIATESQIKRYIRHIRLIDTGQLWTSIRWRVEGRSIRELRGVVFTNDKKAAIHEYGGTIYPKRARALAIPITPEARRLSRDMRVAGIHSLREFADLYPVRFANGVYLFSRSMPGVRFKLQTSVTITEKAFMRTGLRLARGEIRTAFQRAGRRIAREIEGEGHGSGH